MPVARYESQALLFLVRGNALGNQPNEYTNKTPGLVFGADGRAIPVAAEFAPEADSYNAALDRIQQEATQTATAPAQAQPAQAQPAQAQPAQAQPAQVTEPVAEGNTEPEGLEDLPDPRTSPLYRLVTPLETLRGTVALQLLSETMSIWKIVEKEDKEENPGVDLAGTRAILQIFEDTVVPEENLAEWRSHDTLAGIGDMSNFVMGYVRELGNVARSLNI